MGTTVTGSFETRREAEMAIERLVQEHGIERTDIFVAAEGDENTAGEDRAGADTSSAEPTPPDRDDAALNGRVTVSVDLEDDAAAEKVRAAFREFDASGVAQD